jgi:hypothetical protein
MNRRPLVFELQDDERYFRAHGDFNQENMSAVPHDTIALSLESCRVEDDGLRGLPRLTALRCLDLDSTAITDRALPTIASLPALEELWLECTALTDEGLRCLHDCRALKFVSVAYTGVSAAAVAALASAVPGLEVAQ